MRVLIKFLLSNIKRLVFVRASILLVLSILSSAVQAQMQTARNTISSEKKVQGKIGFLSDAYTTPISETPNLNSSKLFSTDFKLVDSNESWSVLGDFQAGHYSEVHNSYFAVREMFFEYKFKNIFSTKDQQLDFHNNEVLNRYTNNSTSSFLVGRKFEDWSLLEQTWSLSLWEPQFTLDALRPIDQGLTGMWFQVQQNNFHFSVFASALYVPNLGPEIKPNDQGQIEVNNRWVKQPNKEFPFNGKSTQILYSLDLPSVSKIINQKSLALATRIGDLHEGPWASVAVAQKPVNDLILSYQGILRLRDDGSFGDVKIVPHVIHHEIGSFDMGYKWQDQNLELSHISERPINLIPESGWNYQQFEAIEVNSIQWSWNVYNYLGERAKIGISRMHLDGGRIHDVDSEMRESHVLDGMRVKFTDAWSVDFQTPILGGLRPLLSSKIHFVRDMVEQGSYANAEFYLKPTANFNFILGADVIGVRDDSDSNKSKGFLNQNRANDRLYSGISYVF